jgi:hypothetical protein
VRLASKFNVLKFSTKLFNNLKIKKKQKKCKSEIVSEYITNCVECLRLMLYEKYTLNDNNSDKCFENQSHSGAISVRKFLGKFGTGTRFFK